MNRKPAFETVTVDFGVPTTIVDARISKTGAIEMFGRDGTAAVPLKAWRTRQRERPKGEKMLTRIPVSPENASMLEGQAFSQYDLVFAVDTNTEQIAGCAVSVACVVQCRIVGLIADGKVEFRALGGFEFHGLDSKQENFSWSLLQQAIVNGEGYSSDHKCLIISDSDLGNHASYNDRSKPIFGDVYLAPGFVLSYASEQGQDVSNEMMRLCHNQATAMLKHLRSNPAMLQSASIVKSGPCTRVRGWANSRVPPDTSVWYRLGQFRI